MERSFYLPEIAAGCTTLSFDNDSNAISKRDNETIVEVAIRSVNIW